MIMMGAVGTAFVFTIFAMIGVLFYRGIKWIRRNMFIETESHEPSYINVNINDIPMKVIN